MNGSSPYLPVAKEISTYLTLGMHHSTPEAQQRMAELIEKGVQEERDDDRPAALGFGLKGWRL